MGAGKVSDASAIANAARNNGVSSRAVAASKPEVPASDAGAAGAVIDPSHWLQGLVILPPIAQITADARPTPPGKGAATAPSRPDPPHLSTEICARQPADAEPHKSSPALPPSAAASPFAAGSRDPDPAPAPVATDVGRSEEGAAAAAVAQLALRARGPSSRDSEAESSMVSEELDSRTSSVSSATGSLTSAGRSGSPGWLPSNDRGVLLNGAAGPEPPLRQALSVRSDGDLDGVADDQQTASPAAAGRPLKARRELSFSPDHSDRTQPQGGGDRTDPSLLRPAEPPDSALPEGSAGSSPRLDPQSPALDVGSHPVVDGSSSDLEDGRDGPSTPMAVRLQTTVLSQNGSAMESPSFTHGDEDLPQGECRYIEPGCSLGRGQEPNMV